MYRAVVGRTVGIICESVSVTDSLSRSNVLPSLYFQMCHHAMSMNNDNNFCICFMHMYNCYSDFIFMHTRVYLVDRRDFLTTDAAA